MLIILFDLISAASRFSGVERIDTGAVFVHMSVGSYLVPITCHVDTVLTEQLTVRQVGVCVNALLGACVVCIEEVQHVDVTGSELSGVHLVVVVHAGCLVDCC